MPHLAVQAAASHSLIQLSLFRFYSRYLFNHVTGKNCLVFSAMSLSRLFTIIGDANVRRNMTGLNIASREAMKSAQVIDCISSTTFDTALAEVRAESTVLIVSTLTEFILSNGFCGTVHSSLDPVLASFVTTISGFCAFRPNLKVCLSNIYFI